jgi:hypothetical protein
MMVYSNQPLIERFQMNAIKNLIVITAISLGIISCSACAKQDQTPIPVPAPVPTVVVPPVTTVVIRNDNLEATLPNDGWKVLDVPEGSFIKAFINPTLKNLVLLSKQADASTYDQFVLGAIRGVKDSGGTLASAKQVTLNGHKFVVLDVTKNNVQFFMWVTLDNGFGYGFSCGGPVELAPHDLCFGVANTVKIN